MATDKADPAQDALFREVDEDLRHDRAQDLWKKYGVLVVAAAVAIVAAVAGQQVYQGWSAGRAAEDARHYHQATVLVDEGRSADAAKALAALAADARPGYRAIALMEEAAALAASGNRAGAVALYRQVASDQGIARSYRDAAALMAVAHGLDGENPAALEPLIQPLSAGDNPWRFQALELSGLLAMRQGDTGRARDIFTRLADDPKAPEGIRARAEEMRTALAVPAAKG